MEDYTHKRIEKYLKIILVIAIGTLIVLSVLLVGEYRQIGRLEFAASHESLFEALRTREPMNVTDVSSIAEWMTFDYLNHLFGLPPQYLQTTLMVTDSRYPRLTLHEYAEDHGVSQSTFLIQVQNAVRTYLTSKQ
jgi:hypothetical protein